VGPSDITVDADAPRPQLDELSGVWSRTSNNVRGQFIAETVRSSFELLASTADGEKLAEYRLPLFPESGAWEELARWIEEFNVQSSRVRWVVQLPQAAYAWLKTQDSVASFENVLDNIFVPPTQAVEQGGETNVPSDTPVPHALGKFLQRDVCALEFAEATGSSAPGGAEVGWTTTSQEPQYWTSRETPPFAYQLFHIWSRLKALNVLRANATHPPLELRCAANTIDAMSCAFLLGAWSISRAGALATHPPLQYLFLLDSVFVNVSLSSKRSLGSTRELGSWALSQLFRAGVPVSLCTEDVTVSQQSENALDCEYGFAQAALGLSYADLAELAQNSLACSPWHAKTPHARATIKKASPEASERSSKVNFENAGENKVEEIKTLKTIRARYRHARRDVELSLVSSLAAQHVKSRKQQ